MTNNHTSSYKKKLTFSWSGGKDSAFALYRLLNNKEFEICSLHTIINKQTGRVGMHGVREELIRQQAACINIPLEIIYLDKDVSNASYEKALKDFCLSKKAQGIHTIGYGDIFLEDLKNYRTEKLAAVDMEAVFPIWKENTLQLINTFINHGFETIICSASAKFFKEGDAGKVIDKTFIENLPEGIDPCGENGEYHTFVYKGPIFNKKLYFKTGQRTYQTYQITTTDHHEENGFWFIDLIGNEVI